LHTCALTIPHMSYVTGIKNSRQLHKNKWENWKFAPMASGSALFVSLKFGWCLCWFVVRGKHYSFAEKYRWRTVPLPKCHQICGFCQVALMKQYTSTKMHFHDFNSLNLFWPNIRPKVAILPIRWFHLIFLSPLFSFTSFAWVNPPPRGDKDQTNKTPFTDQVTSITTSQSLSCIFR